MNTSKKNKRRLSWEVEFYNKKTLNLVQKYFESAKKARVFANKKSVRRNVLDGELWLKKTFCYREYTPRHVTYYCSYYPNKYVKTEKW